MGLQPDTIASIHPVNCFLILSAAVVSLHSAWFCANIVYRLSARGVFCRGASIDAQRQFVAAAQGCLRRASRADPVCDMLVTRRSDGGHSASFRRLLSGGVCLASPVALRSISPLARRCLAQSDPA